MIIHLLGLVAGVEVGVEAGEFRAGFLEHYHDRSCVAHLPTDCYDEDLFDCKFRMPENMWVTGYFSIPELDKRDKNRGYTLLKIGSCSRETTACTARDYWTQVSIRQDKLVFQNLFPPKYIIEYEGVDALSDPFRIDIVHAKQVFDQWGGEKDYGMVYVNRNLIGRKLFATPHTDVVWGYVNMMYNFPMQLAEYMGGCTVSQFAVVEASGWTAWELLATPAPTIFPTEPNPTRMPTFPPTREPTRHPTTVPPTQAPTPDPTVSPDTPYLWNAVNHNKHPGQIGRRRYVQVFSGQHRFNGDEIAAPTAWVTYGWKYWPGYGGIDWGYVVEEDDDPCADVD